MTRLEFIDAAQDSGWLLFSSTKEGLQFRCAHPGCEHSRFISSAGVEAGKVLKRCNWPHRAHSNRFRVTSYSELVYMLRECRFRIGLTQEDLADAAGLADGHINKLENGDRLATMPTLLLWAQTLGFDVVLKPSPMPKPTIRTIDRRVYQRDRARSHGAPRRRLVGVDRA